MVRCVIDLRKPRSVTEIIGATLVFYRRYPALLLLLSFAVVAPYELLVLATIGSAPLGAQHGSESTALVLILVDFALVGPLISALYAHAAVMIGAGERPRVLTVASRVARVLPVVAAAQIVVGLAIAVGLIAFVIPGVILLIRWAVVAQVAAIEHPDWVGALRRTAELTRGNYIHVLGVVALANLVPAGLNLLAQALTGTSTRAGAVAIGIVVATVVRSFTALTTAMLYFDLVARRSQSN
jgi:hypothetical protein